MSARVTETQGDLSADARGMMDALMKSSTSDPSRTAGMQKLWELQRDNPDAFKSWQNQREFKTLEIEHLLRNGEFKTVATKINELLQAGINNGTAAEAIEIAGKSVRKELFSYSHWALRVSPEVDGSHINGSKLLAALEKSMDTGGNPALRGLQRYFLAELATSSTIKPEDRGGATAIGLRTLGDSAFYSEAMKVARMSVVEGSPEKGLRNFSRVIEQFSNLSPEDQRTNTSVLLNTYNTFLTDQLGPKGSVETSTKLREAIDQLQNVKKIDPQAGDQIKASLLTQEILTGRVPFDSDQVRQRLDALRTISGLKADAPEWAAHVVGLQKHHAAAATANTYGDIAAYINVAIGLASVLPTARLAAGGLRGGRPTVAQAPAAPAAPAAPPASNVVSGDRFQQYQQRGAGQPQPQTGNPKTLTMPARQAIPVSEELPIAVGQAPGANTIRPATGRPQMVASTGYGNQGSNLQTGRTSGNTGGSGTDRGTGGTDRGTGGGKTTGGGTGPRLVREPSVPAQEKVPLRDKFAKGLNPNGSREEIQGPLDKLTAEEKFRTGQRVHELPEERLSAALEDVKQRKNDNKQVNRMTVDRLEELTADAERRVLFFEERAITARILERELGTHLPKQDGQSIARVTEIKGKIAESYTSWARSIPDAEFAGVFDRVRNHRNVMQRSYDSNPRPTVGDLAELEVLKIKHNVLAERAKSSLLVE